MVFKKFWRNKKILLGALGVAVLVLGFWVAQAPKAEAATTSAEFIRVKINSSDSPDELWNFFAIDDGQFDEFNVTGTSYTTSTVAYDCGLLLTEEFPGQDSDYILWAKKGTILGSGTSLKNDIDTTAGGLFGKCCDKTGDQGPSCQVDSGAVCDTNVYHTTAYAFKFVFEKTYGTLDDNECNDDVDEDPCDATPAECCALSPNYSGAEYKFEYSALCANDGKWLFTDMPNVCASDGTNNYFATGTADGRTIWTKCASGCAAATGCIGGVVPPGPGPDGGTIVFKSPSKFTELTDLVGSIVNFLSYLAMALAVLMLVIAGFIFLTAGGEPQKVNTAKTLILYTLIALLIIILAKAIGSVVEYATR